MASLIEELIMTLDEEERLYSKLVPVAEKKTRYITTNDLQSLESVTEEEQIFVGQISKLEKKRREVVRNIGVVMNRKEDELNFTTIIALLEGQPKEQDDLRRLHDRLKATVNKLAALNERNQMLIRHSLEMIDFDLNLLQSLRMSPGIGQYNTSSEVEMQGSGRRTFDAKS